VETLLPWQFFEPGTPANFGAGWINTPKATGAMPTGIVALTEFVAVSMTDTVLLPSLAT
jgi:hypothetical protein